MIIIPGFVTMSEIESYEGDLQSIPFPTTGFFLMATDEQGNDVQSTMVLYDEYAHVGHKMKNVTIAGRVNNALEGDKKFPRPFKYQTDKKSGRVTITQVGDKLLIVYVDGSLAKPVVVGSLDSISVLNQVGFLQYQPANLDRQPTRYENKQYKLEFENDGKGGLNFTLTGKKSKDGKSPDGTGNINITVTGVDNTQGQINLAVNGAIDVKQVDANGKTLNEIKMSPTEDIAVQITDQNKNVIQMGKDGVQVQGEKDSTLQHVVYGETLKQTLSDLIDQIKALTVPTGTGPSGPPNNSAAFAQIQNKLEKILTE